MFNRTEQKKEEMVGKVALMCGRNARESGGGEEIGLVGRVERFGFRVRILPQRQREVMRI